MPDLVQPAVDIELLLRSHQPWLRRIAIDLVGPDHAEDLEQQTWLAALERPPRSVDSARAWLAAVARNISVRLRLGEMRRRKREASVAATREQTEVPVDDIVDRIETQRAAARSVTRLDEPFRTAMLLRYYEGMSHAEIAARSGVTESTVRSRVMRGLARVRAQLRDGAGPDWRRALALACIPTGRDAAALGTGLLATTAAKVCAALVVIGLVVWSVASSNLSSSLLPNPGDMIPFAASSTVEERADVAPAVPIERAAVAPSVDAPSDEAASPQPLESHGALTGRVVRQNGDPAHGAIVQLGRHRATADERGEFAIETGDVEADADLVAVFIGDQPAVVADVLATNGTRPLNIVLDGAALPIDGWLLDADGLPCEGWNLELYRGTVGGWDLFPPMLAEDVAAGGRLDLEGVDQNGWPLRDSGPNRQLIGEDGAFHVRGLRRGRDYVLRAWNEQTLQTVVSEPFRAGARGVVFTVPDVGVRPRVNGIVRSRFGAPIPGVRVRLTMRVHQSGGSTSFQTGQTCKTDAQGRFEFVDVLRQELLLRFTGGHVRSLYSEFPSEEDGVGLDIVLTTSCAIRFESARACDEIVLLDAELKPLKVSRKLEPGRTTSGRSVPLEDGKSTELSVPDDACWVLVRNGGEDVARLALKLEPGPVQVVTW